MKHLRTIKDFVYTKVYGSSHKIDIICNEYASVMKFSATVSDLEFPIPIEWSCKKREYKSYELARQHFLAEFYTKAL